MDKLTSFIRDASEMPRKSTFDINIKAEFADTILVTTLYFSIKQSGQSDHQNVCGENVLNSQLFQIWTHKREAVGW